MLAPNANLRSRSMPIHITTLSRYYNDEARRRADAVPERKRAREWIDHRIVTSSERPRARMRLGSVIQGPLGLRSKGKRLNAADREGCLPRPGEGNSHP
jgi:hypothetical protein